jgi:nicotinamide mononucleotide transporter
MQLFKEWTWFERIWLLLFSIVNVFLYLKWDSGLIGLISAMSGMLCVVLVAKGKISNFVFGIVNTATYAYISYGYGLYGESMLNALFYLPTQFIGLWMWQRHRSVNKVRDEDIEIKRLSVKGWAIVIASVVVGAYAYMHVLMALDAQQVRIDSVAVVMSVVAQILLTLRYAEQWVLWILVNLLSIVLWVVTLSQSGGSDYTMPVMWTAFLINSIYGWINWLKLQQGKAAQMGVAQNSSL